MIPESTLQIADPADDETVLPLLERDRRWAGYALCDLDPPYRSYARYIVASVGGRPTSAFLVYATPHFTSLQPFGDPAHLPTILRRVADLPVSPYLLVRRSDLDAVKERYDCHRIWTMLRMAVAAGELAPPPPVGVEILPLTQRDLPDIRALYALYGETVFNPFMLEHGVYFAAVQGDTLVAIAGTQAISQRHRIAMIGNVFTHPDYRGRGLATAVTGAVARALVERGVRDVALNVKDGNLPAIAAYTRLGFTVHETFWEGRGTLRGFAHRR